MTSFDVVEPLIHLDAACWLLILDQECWAVCVFYIVMKAYGFPTYTLDIFLQQSTYT